jgi:hypothetical protein
MRFYDSTHFSPSKCPVVPGLIDAWIGIGVVIGVSIVVGVLDLQTSSESMVSGTLKR